MEGAGEFLKRKSLTGADLVHAMSYDLMPSVCIGISGSNRTRRFLSPFFARLVTTNELLPPGAWCLLTPDHSESLEPFAHTISDNRSPRMARRAWLAAHKKNAALEPGKAAPTVSLLRPRAMAEAICFSIPAQDFSYHVPHSWSRISIHDFRVDRRIGWSSPTADQSLHVQAKLPPQATAASIASHINF